MSLSDLCRSCGLCCDGTLFSHVPLRSSEVDAARSHGLDVVALVGDAPALRQCCAALKDRQCTLYEARPEGCRRYGCRLFGAVAAGTVPLGEALAVVAQAHGLLAEVERGLTPEPWGRESVLERARFAAWGEARASTETLRVARERAEAFLDQHFHGGPRRFDGLIED